MTQQCEHREEKTDVFVEMLNGDPIPAVLEDRSTINPVGRLSVRVSCANCSQALRGLTIGSGATEWEGVLELPCHHCGKLTQERSECRECTAPAGYSEFDTLPHCGCPSPSMVEYMDRKRRKRTMEAASSFAIV